ncbi:unnamed protein product [Lepeophtheirus salmonis]|uniref:(salmon louse) hypothetical protein n=1 Tax=Lepeophtheirus salmonis TaxID=72036 RepID=A0A7R8D3I4_LEPSM|nr:unnamed protein product [Lepeophtheirus salmonis]CAF3017293.1 unnamed protein product [Lepeophtheirus salmonis]
MLTYCCPGYRTGCRESKGTKNDSVSPTTKSKYPLHVFPKNEERKEKWLRSIAREKLYAFKICSGTGCRQHKKAKHESGSPISNSNYSLHIFPKDEDLKNNRHFHESCFRSDRKETRSKLKSNAIPTIFPNEEDIQYSLKLPSLTKILNTSAAFEKR